MKGIEYINHSEIKLMTDTKIDDKFCVKTSFEERILNALGYH